MRGLFERIIRRRPSPAMIVAFVGLFVAGAGTATAAKLITGAQVKDSSLTGADIKDRSLSVREFGGIGASEGAPGPPGPQGLPGPQGARGPQGADGTRGPTGAKGEKGDGGTDGAAGERGPTGPVGPAGSEGPAGAVGAPGDPGPVGPPGPAGPAGSVGPAGPIGLPGPAGPQGPAGATNVTMRTFTLPVPNNQKGTQAALCLPGERATGGGGGIVGTTQTFSTVVISGPTAGAGGAPNAWSVTAVNRDGVTRTLEVYAICAAP